MIVRYKPVRLVKGTRVYALGWPERHGTVFLEGDEVSEIKWDNQNRREYVSNIHLRKVDD